LLMTILALHCPQLKEWQARITLTPQELMDTTNQTHTLLVKVCIDVLIANNYTLSVF